MAQVKVWNDNSYEYKETFKEKEIKIPPHGYVEMEYYDAHEFKGAFKAIQRDGDNQPLPSSFKMIRVEQPSIAPDAKVELNLCPACKHQGATPKALLEHILAEHADQAVVDEEAEKAMASKKKKAG